MLWILVSGLAGLAVGAAAVAAWSRRRLLLRLRADREEARLAREREQVALTGTIASGLAHEIRNPLGTISMNLQLLREDWAEPATEREHRGVRKIDTLLKEVKRLETILNDFLRFAAGYKLRAERVNLNVLAGELLDFAAAETGRARIRVIRAFSPALQAVQADANLLRQTLLNLLLNACQAMPDGGELEVRTEPAPGASRIVVRDTGPGIPPENLERVFTLYFSTKPSGTGLGLPMARKIAEAHGGTLTVESTQGRGSVFTLSLPTLDAAGPPPQDGSP